MWGDRVDERAGGRRRPGFRDAGLRRPDGQSRGHEGRPFVLYFYPRPIRRAAPRRRARSRRRCRSSRDIGIEVIGVSKDKMKPIEEFAQKYGLSLPARLGPDGRASRGLRRVGREIHVRQENMGIERSTFLDRPRRQDRQGVAQGAVNGHAEEVSRAAQALDSRCTTVIAVSTEVGSSKMRIERKTLMRESVIIQEGLRGASRSWNGRGNALCSKVQKSPCTTPISPKKSRKGNCATQDGVGCNTREYGSGYHRVLAEGEGFAPLERLHAVIVRPMGLNSRPAPAEVGDAFEFTRPGIVDA